MGFAFSFTARGRRKEADSAQQKEETEEKIGKEDAAAMSVLPPPPAVDRGEALLCVSSSSRAPPGSEMGKREKPREWRRRRGAATKAPCFKRNGREDAGKPCAMMSLPKDRGIQYFLAVRLGATLKPYIRKPSP